MPHPPAFLHEIERSVLPDFARRYGADVFEACLLSLPLTVGATAGLAYDPREMGMAEERATVVPGSLVPMPTRSTGDVEAGHLVTLSGMPTDQPDRARTAAIARAVMHGFVAGYPEGGDWSAARQGLRHFYAAIRFANEHSVELQRLVPTGILRDVMPDVWPAPDRHVAASGRDRLTQLESALDGWIRVQATGLLDALLMAYAVNALYLAEHPGADCLPSFRPVASYARARYGVDDWYAAGLAGYDAVTVTAMGVWASRVARIFRTFEPAPPEKAAAARAPSSDAPTGRSGLARALADSRRLATRLQRELDETRTAHTEALAHATSLQQTAASAAAAAAERAAAAETRRLSAERRASFEGSRRQEIEATLLALQARLEAAEAAREAAVGERDAAIAEAREMAAMLAGADPDTADPPLEQEPCVESGAGRSPADPLGISPNVFAGREVWLFTGQPRAAAREQMARGFRELGARAVVVRVLSEDRGPAQYPSDVLVVVDVTYAGHADAEAVRERAARAGAFYFQARRHTTTLARWAARAYVRGRSAPGAAAAPSRPPDGERV